MRRSPNPPSPPLPPNPHPPFVLCMVSPFVFRCLLLVALATWMCTAFDARFTKFQGRVLEYEIWNAWQSTAEVHSDDCPDSEGLRRGRGARSAGVRSPLGARHTAGQPATRTFRTGGGDHPVHERFEPNSLWGKNAKLSLENCGKTIRLLD